MAGWFEAASGALTYLAFWSAFPRYGDLGATEPLGGILALTPPSPLSVPANAPIGTVVTSFSVVGGSGTYTYTLLSDALGYFTIVGNQLQVNVTGMVPGTDNIVVQASNGAGDIIQMPIAVIITPTGYVPTYYLYGF